MLTIKQINYAIAVSEALHFKNAADRCFISASTLSNAISEMENSLGFKVFERDNKKVILTELGKEFIQKAKLIKLEYDDIENLNAIKKPPLSSNISLGIIPTISPYFLPIILPGLKRNFPNLRLTISESQSAELISKVKSGIIDIAILALPYDLEGMNAYKFWEEDFYYIHHKNRFSSEKKRIRAKDLDTRELMLLKDGHCLKDHALAACNISKNSNNYQMAASNLNTLIELVAGDLGTTLVPEMAINQLLKTKQDLQKVLLNEPSPHRELAIIARPTYPLIENINLLRNFFEEELKKTHN